MKYNTQVYCFTDNSKSVQHVDEISSLSQVLLSTLYCLTFHSLKLLQFLNSFAQLLKVFLAYRKIDLKNVIHIYLSIYLYMYVYKFE